MDLPKSYYPQEVEKKWALFWEENNLFKPNHKAPKESFCIIMPPPNVTGALHMGHALVDTISDILVRYKRMKGYQALWIPGTDHAGIATQTVVEKHLIQTQGKRRKDFSREDFLRHVWQWKETKQNVILDQIKRLGCSCDWSRLRFTMDDLSNRAVRTLFKKMFDDQLIYRGDYLVNWDPITQTALADDEVEYEEHDSHLWYFRYPVVGSKKYLIIATTRPETMLGDTAIAVNPKDKRYTHLVGKEVLLPIVSRKIPIIADHYVDPEFGSGAVKITPAHDPNDFEIYQRHNIDLINIMTPDGKMNTNVPKEFQNLSFPEARIEIIKKMKALNFLEKIKPHKLRIGISYRSQAFIQPFLSKQWFVKTSSFKDKMISAIQDERVNLIPKHWKTTYYHWIENLRDWCISRQLWWGHRIPVWYDKNDPEKMICYDGEGLPPEVEKNPEQWVQDEDVLDTWFSSATWPFSILGWPEKTKDLQTFYPNSVLVTAHDILFFWVARMVLIGEYVFNQPPFHDAFLHGLIYGKSYWRVKGQDIIYASLEEKKQYDLGELPPHDVYSKWEKMSKSKGNVIDPLQIIEEYGADAMRMALTSSATQARQIDLDRRRFEEYKNFANKIWNGARFIFMNLEENKDLPALTVNDFEEGLDLSLFSLEDKWIISLLNRNIQKISSFIENYQFDHAANLAYEFYWKEFCSYYLELSKPTLFGKNKSKEDRKNKQKLLVIILTALIQLIHPMAPFITEEIFSLLKNKFASSKKTQGQLDPYTQRTLKALKSPACIVSSYPEAIQKEDIKKDIEEHFELMRQIVYAIRNICAEMQLPPSEAIDLFVLGDASNPNWKLCSENQAFITALVRTQTIHFTNKEPLLNLCSHAVIGKLKLLVPFPEKLKQKEISRLLKEKEKLEKLHSSTSNRLNNKEFQSKAPKTVVDKMKLTLVETREKLKEIESKLQKA